MDQRSIFGPFLSLMLLTLLVWTYLFARRIPFILKSKLTPEQFAPLEFTRLSPPGVRNPSDNLKNLFEIPTLFYALCLYLFVISRVDGVYVAVAWVFVVFRGLHSAVHNTFNNVNVRFMLYAASTLAFWFMLARASLSAFL